MQQRAGAAAEAAAAEPQAITIGCSRMKPLPRSRPLPGRRSSSTSYSTWWLYLQHEPLAWTLVLLRQAPDKLRRR